MIALGNRLLAAAAVMAAMALGVLAPSTSLAQEATPEAAMAAGIQNHIHTGTCAELGDVIVPLADLAYGMGMMDETMGMDATPMAGMMGDAVPVAVATTEVELSLDDILAAPHAINLHHPDDGSVYIACGTIAGTPDEQGNLFVGMAEDNDSGLSGVIWLVDDGSGAGTIVTVFLVGELEPLMDSDMDEAATPVA